MPTIKKGNCKPINSIRNIEDEFQVCALNLMIRKLCYMTTRVLRWPMTITFENPYMGTLMIFIREELSFHNRDLKNN